MQKKIFFDKWIVDLTVDNDGHLTVGVNHRDQSKVFEIDEDLTSNQEEWVGRFTTALIEEEYISEGMNNSDE
jgi:hypothetical protein